MDHQPNRYIYGIFVSGLPVYSSKEKLEEIFKKFGELKFIRIFSRKSGKKTQSFAKIRFENSEVHETILKKHQQIIYDKKPIIISELQPPSSNTIVQSLAAGNQDNIAVIMNIPERTMKVELKEALKANNLDRINIIKMVEKYWSQEERIARQRQEADQSPEQPKEVKTCIVHLDPSVGLSLDQLNDLKIAIFDSTITFKKYSVGDEIYSENQANQQNKGSKEKIVQCPSQPNYMKLYLEYEFHCSKPT